MKIKVTREDIDKATKICRILSETGEFRHAGKNLVHVQCCPISQAIRRQTKKKVCTNYSTTCINGKVYHLPEKARQFVEHFDTYFNDLLDPVQPIEFEV